MMMTLGEAAGPLAGLHGITFPHANASGLNPPSDPPPPSLPLIDVLHMDLANSPETTPPLCSALLSPESYTPALCEGADLLDEWLVPTSALRPQDYRFCTVGNGQPSVKIKAETTADASGSN